MHTFADNATEIRFHFNSDFSGDVHVCLPAELTKSQTVEGHHLVTARIPGDLLVKFIAYYYVQPKLIDKIEQMKPDQLLLNMIGAKRG